MDTETRSSLNSKSFLYTIRPMHLSDEPKIRLSPSAWAGNEKEKVAAIAASPFVVSTSLIIESPLRSNCYTPRDVSLQTF